MAKRVSHWPIVNVLHPLFAGIGAFFRRNTEEKSRPLTIPPPARRASINN